MLKKVEILEEIEDYKKAIFRIVLAKLKHEKFNGEMTDEISRLSLERGDAVAAIIHNPEDDTILLTEQFRYPTYGKTDDGWILELPAGMVEEGEDPRNTMHREIEEETGYEVDTLRYLYSFFLSPGGSSERIFLYYGRLDTNEKTFEGGGLDSEGEDIRTIKIPVDEALQMLKDRKFTDAKTILGLQWLQMNRNALSRLNQQDDAEDED